MDFRKLNGASFRTWTHFCGICKRRGGGLRDITNRFLKGGCVASIAKELDYNAQTVSQAIHILKDAGFLTEVRDPLDPRRFAYFLHVILMGEYIQLPPDAETLAMQVMQEEVA